MDFDTPADYLRAFATDPTLAILPLQTVADFREVTRASIDHMLKVGRLEEIRIGKTRYVRVSSLVALQQAYDNNVAIVRSFLEQCARQRRVVTYEPVMALVGLSPKVPVERTNIGSILGTVSEQSYNDHEVLFSVIVHRKTPGKTRPGPGFFNLAEDLGVEWEDNDELIKQETEKVWAFYARA